MAGLYYSTSKEIIISKEEEIQFQNSQVCWLCDKRL